MLELAFCLSMKYWSFIKSLYLAYNFIWSRLIPIENNEEKKATPKHFPKKKFFLSLPAKDSTLKLSLHTINITLFIPAIKIFISKAAKNDLMHARIFRAQTAMHFFFPKNITWENIKTQHSFWKTVTVLL